MELNPATWPLLLKMCFLFGPFFVMFFGMGMITYMAYRDLDRVLNGFSQSQISLLTRALGGAVRWSLATRLCPL
jgi:hypothetical protein